MGQEARGGTDADLTESHAPIQPPPSRPFLLMAMVAWSAGMMMISVVRGSRHDYVAYLHQWEQIRSGVDRWPVGDTYGPLHGLLSYLTIPWSLGPKFAMAAAFVIVNLALFRMLLETNPSNSTLVIYALLVPANFLVVSVVFSFGLNDALATALIGVAIIARFRNRFLWCGISLALAVLLKYYPALLIPFFSLDRRRFEWRILTAAAATIAVGFIAAWLAWGAGFTEAFRTGVGRQAKLLSILSSLDRHQTLGRDSPLLNLLLEINAAIVILACALALLIAHRLRLAWIEGAVLVSLSSLVFYKVGHPQFYVQWLMLVVGLLILSTRRSMTIARACVPFALFLSAFQVGYEIFTDGYQSIGGFIRDSVGFVAFTFGTMTLAAIVMCAKWNPWDENRGTFAARRAPSRSG